MTSPRRLHVKGRGLPDGEPVQWWVVDGVLSAEPVSDAQTVFDGGWIVPGLVDAHCHVGLGEHGPIDNLDECDRAGRDRTRRRRAAAARRRITDRHPQPSTTATTCRASSGPAGTWPGRSATSAGSRSSSRTSRTCLSGRRAGAVGRRLGQARRRLDRPRRRRPGAAVVRRRARRPRSRPRTPTAPASPPTCSARTRCRA